MVKTIPVTRKHIRAGKKRHFAGCPVALALHDNGFPFAIVGNRSFIVDGFTGTGTVMLPRSAVRFISRFDSGKPVKPFNFKVKVDA